MKLTKIEIHNYKTINRLSVDLFKDITLIVGKNNIGKSNVLKAIEIFFKWVDKKDVSQVVDQGDFRKNSTRILLSITFSEIDKLVSNLRNEIRIESKKKRPNQDTIRYLETLFHIFQLLENRFHEFCVQLIIPRDFNKEIKLNIIKSSSKSKNKKFDDVIIKRKLAEKYFFDTLKEKQKIDSEWYNYKWLTINTSSEGEKTVSYADKSYNFTSDKTKGLSESIFNKYVIDYIKLTQKFFYVPAYRGGKSERDEAINKLFDIIIEDLVSPKKGKSKEYDTITDAIWGTGKNTNIYNLQTVIEKRLKQLTTDLKKDSISEIKEIEFEPFSNEEIRRRILKTMLGSTSVYINDGIKTSFESKGTGIQSSFMITLMKALSMIEFIENVSVILVIEEPEAFAHPQLIREIIHKISLEFPKELFQFIVSTHSPVIVNYINSKKIQRLDLIDRETINITNINKTILTQEDWNLINRVSDVNISEIVFSDLVVFVEGEGDKIVFEKLLRVVLPDFYSKISVISLSGNGQIFKIYKLLKYYNINWMMILDKDSFVEKGSTQRNLTSVGDLEPFFKEYQIGSEFQGHYKGVLQNNAVSKIQISVQSTNIKFGRILDKMGDIFKLRDNGKVKEDLFKIASEKLNDDVFPEKDAVEVTENLNKKLEELRIPFFSLSSDLEGMIINQNTLEETMSVYKKYYLESYNDFNSRYKNANETETLKALRKTFGSKTHLLENASRSKKKPHIPIEIITDYIENVERKSPDSLRETMVSSFDILENLMNRIIRKLQAKL